MLFSKIYRLCDSVYELDLAQFYANPDSKTFTEEESKLCKLILYIALLYNLNEEILKINFRDLFTDDEKIDMEDAFLNMDYCCKKIILHNEDKHIPEIGLFKIAAEMVYAQLTSLTCIPKDSTEYQKIVSVYTAFRDYEYNGLTDISLHTLGINDINVLQSNITDYEFSKYYDNFVNVQDYEYDKPDKVKQCFTMIQALFEIDIFDNYGYMLTKSESQPFREYNLFKGMLKIIVYHSKTLKNEFDKLKAYISLRKECKKLIQL